MEIPDGSAEGPRQRKLRGCNRVWALAILTVVVLSNRTQGSVGRQGRLGRGASDQVAQRTQVNAYLDPASVLSGDDGLIYFNESSNVSRPEEMAKVGLMKDAYDCGKTSSTCA
jgi:hypothetical protein